jgi:flavin reductase (DIM6/NTAB) family NADH-FMN oxidoreductase RutF
MSDPVPDFDLGNSISRPEHNGQMEERRTLEDPLQNGLKQAMRVYPQGVTVVTTQTDDGPKGMTVSSFISVSLSPPLVLVSIAKGSPLDDPHGEAKGFAVNFLADDQKSVSDRFAGRTDALDRFDGLKFKLGVTGSPIIDGVRAVIECKTWRVYEGGDHSLVIGEVVAAQALSDKRPLVYYAQQYTTIELSERPGQTSGSIL